MAEITAYVLAIAGVYLLVLLVIGWWSYRKTLPTPEDFFMAGRAFGPVVLIFAVYATNMTAFYMLGTPGNAYRQGIGTYGYIAFASALVIPAMFYFIGYRAWLIGKRYGYMTPSELFGARYESPAVALVLFVLLVFYTVPYIVTSVIGAGLALESLTQIPYLWGAVGVLLITVLYTVFGGMRGTAWTSVFQGLVFIVIGLLAFVMIANALGGFEAITQRVYAERPELLQRSGNFDPKDWFSFLFVAPLAVIAFPHVFMRVLTGKSQRTLKALTVVYPLLFLVTWPPVIWGVGQCGHAGIGREKLRRNLAHDDRTLSSAGDVWARVGCDLGCYYVHPRCDDAHFEHDAHPRFARTVLPSLCSREGARGRLRQTFHNSNRSFSSCWSGDPSRHDL